MTSRDARVRKPGRRSRFDHVSMDGQVVPLNQPFVTPAGSRMMYPGDRSLGAPLGDRANCRCLVRGVDLET
ncbi:MAG: hypothetical protein HC933_23050 [Pleurocapsa sp. SU_196_0]|nr:hypothetical protein [Pleurocapsa sp. SU_196_0]